MGGRGDYRAMRYEDVAWIREAYYERLSLQQQNVVTAAPLPLVIGKTPVTPADLSNPGWAVDGFLDPDLELSTISVSYDPLEFVTNVTVNAYSDAVPLAAGPVTNRQSHITQPMANGTEDVYTNSWYTTVLEQVTQSNTYIRAHTGLDACFVGGVAVGLTNSPGAFLRSDNHWHDRAAVTNWMHHLRLAHRLAVRRHGAQISSSYQYAWSSDDSYGPSRNGTGTNDVAAGWICYIDANNDGSHWSSYFVNPVGSATATIASGYPADLMGRIGSATAFADVNTVREGGAEAWLCYPLGQATISSTNLSVTLPLVSIADAGFASIGSTRPTAHVRPQIGRTLEACGIVAVWFIIDLNPTTQLEEWNE